MSDPIVTFAMAKTSSELAASLILEGESFEEEEETPLNPKPKSSLSSSASTEPRDELEEEVFIKDETKSDPISPKRRHFTFSEHDVVLRKNQANTGRSRHRHTLFDAGTPTNGSIANLVGSGVPKINYDIEAVKLEHGRKIWKNGEDQSGRRDTRKLSISSEESLSDFEELGITHHLDPGRQENR